MRKEVVLVEVFKDREGGSASVFHYNQDKHISKENKVVPAEEGSQC